MAIPPPWTSDAAQNEKPKSCAATPKLVSNCLLLSSAFFRTPFAPPLAAHSKPSPDIFRDFHNSLASAAHRFLANLHSVAAANPLFQKLFAFSARFTSSRPINCRNYSSNSIAAHNFAAILPGDSVAGIVVTNGILNFLNIYNTLLVVRLVLTWFPNSPPAIVSPLSTLCDPYLNIFRGIIPPLGGTLDLSPILAFLVLNVFTSTAAALPAELPVTGASHSLSSSDPQILNLTSTQKKWMRRVSGNRAKNSGGVN